MLNLLQISNTTVKVGLTYCCGGVQVLVLFLGFRCCSLRMLGQDLLFLVSTPLPHQPYLVILSLQARRCSAKLISSVFSGSLLCPHQTVRLHCACLSTSSCLLDCLNQVHGTTETGSRKATCSFL